MDRRAGLPDVMAEITSHVRESSKHLTIVHVGAGISVNDYRQEMDEMLEVLLGRKDPPIDVGIGTLMEVSEAYYARATEMEIIIKRGESEGTILKGSAAYKFRTGELRSFLDLVKRSVDLGSRRITLAKMAMYEFGD